MALDDEQKQNLLQGKVDSAEHSVWDAEVELEALKAESAFGSENDADGYAQRVADAERDLEKRKARLKSYQSQLGGKSSKQQ